MLDTILSMFGWEKEEPASKIVHAPSTVNINIAPEARKSEEKQEKQEQKTWSVYSCPFCNGNVLSFMEQTVATGGRHDGVHRIIYCEKCGAKGPLSPNKDSAVENWNKPALDHNRLAKQINELEKEVEELKASKKDDVQMNCLDMLQDPWKTVVIKHARPSRKPSKVAAGLRRKGRQHGQGA